MLLRQHFMSSQTVGRWKNWEPSLGQHWGDVHKELQRTGSMATEPDMQHLLALNDMPNDSISSMEKAHVPGLVGKCLRQETFRPPTCAPPPLLPHEANLSSSEQPLLAHEQGNVPAVPEHVKFIKTTTDMQEELDFSESEDESADVIAPVTTIETSQNERQLIIARQALHKWWRSAGLNKRKGHDMGFEKGEELGVAWTRGICPRVEGRIKTFGEYVSVEDDYP